MKKIPTLFVRDPETNFRFVKNEVNPVAQWVVDGEGIATRKYDGTCVLIRDGRMFGRRELKAGQRAPEDFEPIDFDEETRKTVGWVPVTTDPEWRWHREAWQSATRDGTYELVGPKIQGNPEDYATHVLVSHDLADLVDAPRTFDSLREFMRDFKHEGIVWHHPDGRMAKLKRKDFPRQ